MTTWEDRERALEQRPLWTAFKALAGAALVILALGVVLMPFGWGFGWLQTASRVTGAANTEDQAYHLRDDYESMVAASDNYCSARAAAPSTSANDPQIIGGSPAEQYAQTYRRIRADYNRRMANAFEAAWIRRYPMLRDLPRRAPTLEHAARKRCPGQPKTGA